MLQIKLLKLTTRIYSYILKRLEASLTKQEQKEYNKDASNRAAAEAKFDMAYSIIRQAQKEQELSEQDLVNNIKTLNSASNFISNAKEGIDINQYL